VPYSLTVDHQHRRVTCVASGVVTFNDVALYITDRIQQGAYHYAQLIDARDVTIDFPPGESVYAHLMATRRELKTGAMPPTAIIATQGTANFGYARQIATHLGFAKIKIEVFTNPADAETWLARTETRAS
jgi:hypothetical protein